MTKLSYVSEQRKEAAEKHVAYLQETYYDQIAKAIENSEVINQPSDIFRWINHPDISVVPLDSVSAVFEASERLQGRIAIHNFASYYNPGGGYIHGTMAQEEALCAESILYPVLSSEKFANFYEENGENDNNFLFDDRGIYSKDILFHRDGKEVLADVITVAAPNRRKQLKSNGTGEQFHWNSSIPRPIISGEENYQALKKRITFVLYHAYKNNVDHLILGAFGCGVFAQDPYIVAKLFKDLVKYYPFKSVTFAVMESQRDNNYEIFKGVFDGTIEPKEIQNHVDSLLAE